MWRPRPCCAPAMRRPPPVPRPARAERSRQMAQLKVTQTKSKIGGTRQQRDSLRSLGLKRIGDGVVKDDRPEFRGMIRAGRHLVTVEEVDWPWRASGSPRAGGPPR